MTQYVQQAQKERERWLQQHTNSNSNPRMSQDSHRSSSRGKTGTRSEIISDNARLLAKTIRQKSREADPATDANQFNIVKTIAMHIEQR